MARSPAGVYTLPAGNPVSTGQVISSTLWNETFGDLAAEITESLDRSGRAVMEAPFQLDDGTAANPGLTFATETDSGLYREGASDLRMVIGGVPVTHWTPTGVVLPAGVTIAQTGTGSGLTVSGGSSDGAGLTATGGVTNGKGVVGNGTGTGYGGHFTGGTTGEGVVAQGGTAKVGIYAEGGVGGGGGYFQGGAATGTGVYGYGTGTGAGIEAEGGDTSGTGGVFTGGAPNGVGLNVTGTGLGEAILATGGSASSAIQCTTAAVGQSAFTARHTGGGQAAAFSSTAGGGVVVVRADGYLDLSAATNPNGSDPFTSTITPKNIIKAWARVTTNSSTAPTINSRFNISGVSVATSTMTFTFATGLSAGQYAAVATCNSTGTSVTVPTVDTSSGTEVTLRIVKFTNANVTPGFTNMQSSDTGTVINLIVTGIQ